MHSGHGSGTPLCVDLDGTLIRSDVLWETMVLLVKRNPFSLLLFAGWILRGRPYFKRQISSRVAVPPELLPYNLPFLEYLKDEKRKGRALVLATAADRPLAESVAKHLGIFDEVIATDEGANLAGRHKAEAMVKAYGEKGFDYAGNEHRDLKIWPHARHAILVNAPVWVGKAAAASATVERTFDDRAPFSALLKSLRPHQWLKNLLIFVPVVTAHRLGDLPVLQAAALAFMAFSLCASSVYLLNDLFDLEADRRHARKRARPLASGALTIRAALAAAFVLLIGSGIVASFLPVVFAKVLAVYFLCTLGYSLYLKQVKLADVLLLAALYTLRIVAGHAATGLKFSFWLLLMALFLFLSLALVKRCSELFALKKEDKTSISGRGYAVRDLAPAAMLGLASASLSVLVLALYIRSADVMLLYRRPDILWLTLPVLLAWLGRMWLLTHRGRMDDDPILFALKDPLSYGAGLLMLGVMMAAS